MTTAQSKPPLIAHVIHRLQVGGLENGLVNLINNLPENRYRHIIICLTEATDFKDRITRKDVPVFELHKRDGIDIRLYFRLWKLIRKLRPTIVHSRNLAALESSVVAALAGVPCRIHGEHGRDMVDLYGKNRKYQILRKLCSPFIHKFIALSKDLELWLRNDVRIPANKIIQIYNGVDTTRFYPTHTDKPQRKNLPKNYAGSNDIVIGTVGRLEPVKDQVTLVRAFLKLVDNNTEYQKKLRLVLLGDGSLRAEIEKLLKPHIAKRLVWLAGSKNDVGPVLRDLDIFILPSLAEGISNTILEAMASGLPVVATGVGGNLELVQQDLTGYLVPSNNPDAIFNCIRTYIENPELRQIHGVAARKRVEDTFSLSAMVDAYNIVYDKTLKKVCKINTNKNK